jgi:hypothetical protein
MMALFHFLLPPVASLTYAIKTQYWTPFALSTVVGVFVSFFSFGLAMGAAEGDPGSAFWISFFVSSFLGLIPVSISFFLFRTRIMTIRARNNIYSVEDADRLLFEKCGILS